MATILIVDDQPDNLYVLERLLKGKGYDVLQAETGQAALDIAVSQLPDLILLDVMMPQVDGWEMLRRMQERHGVGTIPVVMFSGKVDERAPGEAASRGAQGFIGNPFDPQQLIDSAKAMLPT